MMFAQRFDTNENDLFLFHYLMPKAGNLSLILTLHLIYNNEAILYFGFDAAAPPSFFTLKMTGRSP
jgi:hypothetical protein